MDKKNVKYVCSAGQELLKAILKTFEVLYLIALKTPF